MITDTETDEMTGLKCPVCQGDALYHNGRIRNGKRRYLCLICGRQFTPDATKPVVTGKPSCTTCGRPMNVYMIEGPIIRFRCSGYPGCRTFRKYSMTEET